MPQTAESSTLESSSRGQKIVSFSRAAGLRFRALRVHRKCQQLYTAISPAIGQKLLVGIRSDHYFPWLFEPLCTVPREHALRVASAAVLLSDSHLILQQSMYSNSERIQIMLEMVPKLRVSALQQLESSDEENRLALQAFSLQDSAFMEEREHIQSCIWSSPEAAENLERRKYAHIEILLTSLFYSHNEPATEKSAEILYRFIDVSNRLEHFLRWKKSDVPSYASRFHIFAQDAAAASINESESPVDRSAYGEIGKRYIDSLRTECGQIARNASSMTQLALAANELRVRLEKLSRDLWKDACHV